MQAGASSIQPPGGHTGFVFRTDGCRSDFEVLKERGVSFVAEPAEMPFGIQAQFTDPDGNLFSLAEPRISGAVHRRAAGPLIGNRRQLGAQPALAGLLFWRL